MKTIYRSLYPDVFGDGKYLITNTGQIFGWRSKTHKPCFKGRSDLKGYRKMTRGDKFKLTDPDGKAHNIALLTAVGDHFEEDEIDAKQVKKCRFAPPRRNKGRLSLKRPVYMKDLKSGDIVRRYPSISAAARHLMVPATNVQAALRSGKFRNKYMFEYAPCKTRSEKVPVGFMKIKSYEGYWLSEKGQIYSETTKHIQEPHEDKYGDKFVKLRQDGKTHKEYLDDLFLESFLE